MVNTKTITPYIGTTAVLLILGLLILGYGQYRKQNTVVVFGIVLLFASLIVALIAHHKNESWAPPIDGRQFMGLANPGKMASANYAELLASENNCDVCTKTAKTCMRYPFDKACYEAKQRCAKSVCNPNVKEIVLKHTTI